MRNPKLSTKEIDELIHSYKSELKKVRFEQARLKEIIDHLTEQKKGIFVDEPAKKTRKQRSKSAIKTIKKATPKKRGRKPKLSRKTRLSNWDQLIVDSLKRENKPLVNQDLMDIFHAQAKIENLNYNDGQIKAKLGATLHKLANKHNAVLKHDIEGKGFAYGLPEWFYKNGKIKKDYLLKLL